MFGVRNKLVVNVSLLLLLVISVLSATPFVASGGFITPQGKNDVMVNLFYCPYTGHYDRTGLYSAYVSGETRLDYTALFDLKYGTSRDSDVQILLPYMNKVHTLANGNTFSAIGIGDLMVIGRQKSNESKNTDAMLTIGMGVKVPTGMSIFKADKNALATGSGTWDAGIVLYMQENTGGLLLYTDVGYWYRFGVNVQKFAGFDISSIKAGETEVKFTPGTVLKYNVGVELSIIKQFSLVGELMGTVYYDSKYEYASNSADATNDLRAIYDPDYTLEKSTNIRVAAGAKIYLSDKVVLGGGVSFPVTMINTFGNITYLGHCRLFF